MDPVDPDEFADQIDYLKGLIDIDHIAISSNYCGTGRFAPAGLEMGAALPLIVYQLLKQGYSEAEIEPVMDRTFVTLFQAVKAIAEPIPAYTRSMI